MTKKTNWLIAIAALAFMGTGCKPSNSIDDKLKEAVAETNKMLPKQLDDFTRLDSMVSKPGKKVEYHYTLIQDEVSQLQEGDVEAFKAKMTPTLLENIKSNEKMKLFKDNEVSLLYVYHDKNGANLTTIEVDPSKYKQ